MNKGASSYDDHFPRLHGNAAPLRSPRPLLPRRKSPWPGPTLCRPPPRRRLVPAERRLGAWGNAVAWWLWTPFTVGHLAGVPVQFHSTFLLHPTGTIVWLVWSDLRPGNLWYAPPLLAIFCLSLLVHEFAHIFAARRYGIGAERMIFLPTGALALLNSLPRLAQEFWVALAGPLASFALAGLCELASWATQHWLHAQPRHFLHDHAWLRIVLKSLDFGCYLNFCLAIFNLLPVFPMDGGRILRSLLAVALGKFTRRTGDAAVLTATRILVRYVAWPLVLGAIVFTITSTHIWSHLFLFPVLLVLGECEYWILREQCPEIMRRGRSLR